nr:hypothetical protein [Tanacetum cinerariifolium]
TPSAATNFRRQKRGRLGELPPKTRLRSETAATISTVEQEYSCNLAEESGYPLIEAAIKGFAAASAVLKPERLKVDKHGMSESLSYYLID